MNKDFLCKMKDSLILQKKEILIKANRVPDIDAEGDETDEIQANLLAELVNQLTTRDIAKIHLIDDALHKIENNTYGLCEDCEDGIPEKRLSANPYFLTCVFCAEEREFEEKQKRRY